MCCQEKRNNLWENEKEKIYDDFVNLAKRIKKEEHKNIDHDDLDYFGITELEKLFGDIDNVNYYKPVLVRSSFKKNYKYYESRGDKEQEKIINKAISLQDYTIFSWFNKWS